MLSFGQEIPRSKFDANVRVFRMEAEIAAPDAY